MHKVWCPRLHNVMYGNPKDSFFLSDDVCNVLRIDENAESNENIQTTTSAEIKDDHQQENGQHQLERQVSIASSLIDSNPNDSKQVPYRRDELELQGPSLPTIALQNTSNQRIKTATPKATDKFQMKLGKKRIPESTYIPLTKKWTAEGWDYVAEQEE